MKKINTKMIEMEIRKKLPDSMSYTQKYKLLEKLADEYRTKSQREVNDSVNKFRAKNIEKVNG